jgi:hypothetical protein
VTWLANGTTEKAARQEAGHGGGVAIFDEMVETAGGDLRHQRVSVKRHDFVDMRIREGRSIPSRSPASWIVPIAWRAKAQRGRGTSGSCQVGSEVKAVGSGICQSVFQFCLSVFSLSQLLMKNGFFAFFMWGGRFLSQ